MKHGVGPISGADTGEPDGKNFVALLRNRSDYGGAHIPPGNSRVVRPPVFTSVSRGRSVIYPRIFEEAAQAHGPPAPLRTECNLATTQVRASFLSASSHDRRLRRFRHDPPNSVP